MASITLEGTPLGTWGELPRVGSKAPDFRLVKRDLTEIILESLAGKKVVLNIFPSIDTPVCSASVRRFNSEASGQEDTIVLCISADLPFAHERFCGAEGLENVISLSTFRDQNFGKDYGVIIIDGPLKGLMSRAVVVIDTEGIVKYTEQVGEITREPDYESALAALN